MRRAAFAAFCAALVLLAPAHARRRKTSPQLMQVLSPAGRATASAHPDVNIVIRFTGGAVADSFRARLNGRDVTGRFTPLIDNGRSVGVRAVIPNDMVRVGRSSPNRLRARIKGTDSSRGRPARQIVRVKFRALDTPNQPPVASIVPDSEVLLPDVALGFDAATSFDPELDEISYTWDLGDSVTATGVTASRAFPDADQPRTVTLTVSDGQASSTAQLTLRSCQQPDGTTAGAIQVEADGPLEFGAVAPGTTATRTFEIVNRITDPSSHLTVCMGVEGAGFSVDTEQVDVGPAGRASVTVTFAPTAEGHASAMLVLVGAGGEPITGEFSRKLVTLLARGYGGAAPGAGPVPVSDVAFYRPFRVDELRGVLPSGAAFSVTPRANRCAATDGGINFSDDLCFANRDCGTAGQVCPANDVCGRDSERAGQTCSSPYDCPISVPASDPTCTPFTRYDCPASSLDVTEMCGDGAGGLYVLSEDTYTDPNGFDKDLELANTVMRLGVDANGNTTSRTVLSRITDESIRMACDRFTPDQGGRVFIANAVDLPDTDCRDKREELLALRKNGNGSQALIPRLDAIEGVGECDFEDEVTHLEVSGDGSQTFASFESGGIWRVRPSPLQFVDSSFNDDVFRLHPDGSVIFVTVRDGATKATVSLYKVMASQVAAGPLPVGGLPPCATIQIPNNRKGSNRSRIPGLAVSAQSANSRDATVLVSVTTTPLNDAQDQCAVTNRRIENLLLRGTLAFSVPANSAACTPLGFVNLEGMDQLTF